MDLLDDPQVRSPRRTVAPTDFVVYLWSRHGQRAEHGTTLAEYSVYRARPFSSVMENHLIHELEKP